MTSMRLCHTLIVVCGHYRRKLVCLGLSVASIVRTGIDDMHSVGDWRIWSLLELFRGTFGACLRSEHTSELLEGWKFAEVTGMISEMFPGNYQLEAVDTTHMADRCGEELIFLMTIKSSFRFLIKTVSLCPPEGRSISQYL
ncbi:hypothetical protein Mapa_007238 [Marchantia paleacea]|nr:hypothetical protein Mapa_007238 [Marchantia paleacea]